MKPIMLAVLIILTMSVFITLVIYRDYTDRIELQRIEYETKTSIDTCQRQLRQCSYVANKLNAEMNKIKRVIDKNGICKEL